MQYTELFEDKYRWPENLFQSDTNQANIDYIIGESSQLKNIKPRAMCTPLWSREIEKLQMQSKLCAKKLNYTTWAILHLLFCIILVWEEGSVNFCFQPRYILFSIPLTFSMYCFQK